MVGYNSRCKLCNCEYRADAEKLHEDGASLQQVADFLTSHDVSISKASVRRHFDTHFSPKDEAAKRYHEQSNQLMEEAVEKRLTDLQMLNATIQSNYELHQGTAHWLKDRITEEKSNGVFMDHKPMVDLLTGTSSEIRQAIKLKSELLGEDPDKPTRVMIVDDFDDES